MIAKRKSLFRLASRGGFLLCFSLHFSKAFTAASGANYDYSAISANSAAVQSTSSASTSSAAAAENFTMKTPTTTSTTSTTPTTFADTSESYRDLLARLQQIKSLEQAAAVLHYDQMVSMPEAAAAARGAQMAALAAIIHEKNTHEQLQAALVQAEADFQTYRTLHQQPPVTRDEHHVVALARRELDKKLRIPPALEAKRASLSAAAYAAWNQARQNNDFATFKPVLQDCFNTAKETAEAIRGDKQETDLYTVLLDEFERGMPATRIDEIFNQIQDHLVPLLKRVLAADTVPTSEPFLKGTFDIDAQKALSRTIVTALGFDETRGRIDVSVHPFTTSFSPADVRITSRFNEREWYQGLAGSIHEAGHAMYGTYDMVVLL